MRIVENPLKGGVRPHLTEVRSAQPAYAGFLALYAGYIALPVIAGLDKFSHVLTDWNQYLAPAVARLAGGRVDAFMNAVGVIEIAAGVLVAIKPRVGGLVVCFWLLGIIANLFMIPGYFDVALRDFGLSIGAFALSRLSAQYARN